MRANQRNAVGDGRSRSVRAQVRRPTGVRRSAWRLGAWWDASRRRSWVFAVWISCSARATFGAQLAANQVTMQPGTTATVTVTGVIAAEPTYGVTLQLQLLPRFGTTGTLRFTTAPPTDITAGVDPWPGSGSFMGFDTDMTGVTTENGSVDDNGTFVEAPLTFTGPLANFPIVASADAGGTWDVLLTTGTGDSQWEGSAITTTRVAGTVTVHPAVSLLVNPVAVQPGGASTVVVRGTINGLSTFGVTVLAELVPRAGATGTVEFTPSPPVDVVQLGDPWPGAGTFSAFDTDGTGSATLNGTVDDNGSFVPGPVTFSGPLSRFPIQASAGADGVWDVLLSTSAGSSGWEGVATALLDGAVTVTPSACTAHAQCDDANVCTDDACVSGICENIINAAPCNDGNACTQNDLCVSGLCVGVLADGASCDDGDPCTINDTCLNAACAGVPKDCSGVADSCNAAVCNALTGACEPVPSNEGGACDDGVACTNNDLCVAGACVGTVIPEGGACDDGNPCTQTDLCTANVCGGSPVDCSPFDGPCSVGNCSVLAGGCVAVPINEGFACDDGESCTTGDTCTAGFCVGSTLADGTTCIDGTACTSNDQCTGGVCDGVPVDCSFLNDQCIVGTCEPVSGFCTLEPTNEGGACNDFDPCTTNDLCVAGACSGTPIDCSSLNGICIVGVCNQTSGLCEALPALDGFACDDGVPCTLNDACLGGVCGGTPRDCSALNSPCAVGVCNPGDGACIPSPINQGASCTDNNRCTTGDVCTNGACVGVPLDCSSLSNACNLGVCHSASGTCRTTPANNGGACNDGLSCTAGDVCSNGACAGTLVGLPRVNVSLVPRVSSIRVGQPLLVDIVATSGTCINQPYSSAEVIVGWDPAYLLLSGLTNGTSDHTSSFPNDAGLDGLNAPFAGTPANDGDALYLAFAGFSPGGVAAASGTILGTLTFTPLDGITTTALAILPSAGLFTQTRVIGAMGQMGQDITGTMTSAVVALTECTVSADCNDGNVCTTDTCTASNLCSYANNTLACNDGVFCTATDTCSGGACVGSGNTCPGQLCNETLDRCVNCLTNANCNDGNPCTDNVCNAIGNCTFPNNALSCNDNLFCTATDVCSGGACVGSGNRCPGQACDEAGDRCVQCLTAADCNDNNVCTTDSCNTVTGTCVHTPNTLPCSDGNFCTLTDVCGGGSCIGSGTPCVGQLCNEATDQCVNCINATDCPSDGNPCTDERCISGNCLSVNNTLPCSDGLFCTATDTCSLGACVGSGNRCPGQICDEAGDRCVQCLTNAHCNDGIGCTTDVCNAVAGTCTRSPNHAICSDGLFCTGAETCNVASGCTAGTAPCDTAALCNESTDSCGCGTPTVVAESSRGVSVTPASGFWPVALRVQGAVGDAATSCLSAYVQADGRIAAAPVFRTPAQWATVHVADSEVIPDKTYRVQSDCRLLPGDPANLSAVVSATTWRWGDVDHNLTISFRDVSIIVDGFQGRFNQASIYAMDLHDCVPSRTISFQDVSAAVEAFKGRPYPCPNPCP